MNPYLTVGSPNYAAPLLNFGGGQQGQGQGQQGQQGNAQQLGARYAQILQKLMGGQGGAGAPLNIGGQMPQMTTMGGTSPFGGSAGAIY